MAKARKPKARVASAVGSASAASGGALYTAREIEEAMSGAILAAQKEGITDPAKVKDRMMKARESFVLSRRDAAAGE